MKTIWNLVYSLLLIALSPIYLVVLLFACVITAIGGNASIFDTLDRFNNLLSNGFFPMSSNSNKIGNINGNGNNIKINQKIH